MSVRVRRRGAFVLGIGAAALLALVLAAVWIARPGPEDAGIDATRARDARSANGSHDLAPPGATTSIDAPDSTRERATPERAPVSTARTSRSDAAILHVRVTAREDGRALHHVYVSAWADGGTALASGQAIQTDEEGSAELEVPLGTDLFVCAVGDGAMAGRATVPIAALAPGERRDVAISIPSAPDLVFCARLLDRATSDPIPGASVVVLFAEGQGQPALTTSRGDGRFELHLRSWITRGIQVDAPAHGRALVRPSAGHETPARALDILLEKSASLVARVLRADGSGVAGQTVELRAPVPDLVRPAGTWIEGIDRSSIAVASDGEGVARFSGLTANVPWRIGVGDGRTEYWSLAHPLVLAPGESREIACLVEAGATITGHVREIGGQPIAELEIWLAPSRSVAEGFFDAIDAAGARRAFSDAQGAFRYEAVAAGSWWVGPGVSGDPGAAHDVPPLAVAVEVLQNATEVPVEIVVERGLTIRGRVVDDAGRPASTAWVQGWRIGTAQFRATTCGPDGAFTIGPLVRGEWSLRATAHTAAPSMPVIASAGADDVVLKLTAGSTLRARVRDARGEPVAGAKVIARPRGPEAPAGQITGADGLALFERLVAGAWTLVATTGDGRVAVREEVEIGHEDPGEIALVLAEGARLRVRFVGPGSDGYITVLHGETVVGLDVVLAGQTVEMTVPLGPATLRMHGGAGGLTDREIDLRAGASPELVFDGAWK